MSDYYNISGSPGNKSSLSSAVIRNEFALIAAGFGKLPTLTGHASEIVQVNASGNGLQSLTIAALMLAAGSIVFNGALSGITDLTTTGNTILGNAVGDTLNVANGSLRVDASGNVGIGTTPTERLTVNSAGVNTYATIRNSGASVLALTSGIGFDAGGAGAIYTTTAVPLVFGTNSGERMRIDSTGRVGIGKTPATTLDVQGIGQFLSGAAGTFNHLNVGRTSSEARIAVAANANDFLSNTATGDALFYSVGTGAAWYGVAGAGPAIFVTNNAERVRIDATGHLLVGATTSVLGTAIETGLSKRLGFSADNANAYVYANGPLNVTVTTADPLYFATNNAERMRIDSSGNVGIGGTPGSRFETFVADAIVGAKFKAGTNLIRIRPYVDATIGSLIEATNLAESSYGLLTLNGSQIRLSVGGGEAVRIDASGHVGFGAVPGTYHGRFTFDGSTVNGLVVEDTVAGGVPTLFNVIKNGSSIFNIDSIGTLNGQRFNGIYTKLTQGVYITGNGAFDTAAVPKFVLDVNGSISRLYAGGPNAATKGSYEFHVITSNGSSDLVAQYIDANANVGIGITSSGARLHVYKAAAQTSVAIVADAAQSAVLQVAGNGTTLGATSFDFVHDINGNAYVFQRGNSPLIFGTNNTERARFTAAGLFGIGKTPTTYALEVNGDVQATNFRGAVVGNASTATTLATVRAINGVNFDGSADISINLNNALTAGNYLTSGGTFNGSAARTFAVDATSANTPSKVVARDGSGNFSAGTITAALTGNVTGDVTGAAALTLSSTGATAINFNPNGANKFVMTSDGRFYGTAIHNNAGAMTGTTNQYVGSGTYTPTFTNVNNVPTLVAKVCQWLRVGNAVTVSGQVGATPTVGGTYSIGISLPIASTLASTFMCAGFALALGAIAGDSGGAIYADTTNNRATVDTINTATGARFVNFQFTYLMA